MQDYTYSKNDRGIVSVAIDMADQSVNVMNDAFVAMLDAVLTRLEAEKDGIAGVIIGSGKSTFVAGGDVAKIMALIDEGAAAGLAFVDTLKSLLRRLETLGRPIVAAINGSALGGGLELALACHYRVALDNPKTQIGFPEVGLGLLPAGGGVVRSVRMVGLLKALPLLTEGKRLTVQQAMSEGLIDAIAADQHDMIAQAEAWILANPEARQPWDRKGFSIPGGDMFAPQTAAALAVFPSMIFKKTRGLAPAAGQILGTAAESTQLGFDAAMKVESRNFCDLLMLPTTKNLIQAMFFDLNAIAAGASRPVGPEKSRVRKVGILGAGMMGRGIAFSVAMAGIDAVLKDVSADAAEQGKAYSRKLLDKRVERGTMQPAQRDECLARIVPTIDMNDLSDCDLLIEAVFEDVTLKSALLCEAEAVLPATALIATNTSTLPISKLATAVSRPADFIGLHFFSPVDKMHVVEIIRGRETSDACVARAFDFVQQIRKTPIIVNDHRGFFTSRVFIMGPDEADRMVKEGVDPALIENVAKQAGMPVGPLSVQDEVMMDMFLRGYDTNVALDQELGDDYSSTYEVCAELCRIMCDRGRPGRAAGAGFYDYGPDGDKRLWSGLVDLFGGTHELPLDDVRDRLMYRMLVEAARCLDEGVVDSLRDGNIGSILAFGFPPHTGGVFQYIQSIEVDRFVARAEELAATYGPRFTPPPGLAETLARHQ